MNIIIVGAGLIGVSSAYFLQKSGHQVTVIDRQPSVALETSFANGGQISVCYSEPWSSFDNLKNIVKWIGKEDSPILLKPDFSIEQIKWGSRFLLECLPYRNRENIKSMLKLSLYSRKTLQEMRRELNLSYNQNTTGILTFYTSEETKTHGIEAAKFMSQFGCERIIKTKNETLEIEPTLQNSSIDVFGSDYTVDDESGDAKLYTEELYKICVKLGVKFIFSTSITEIKKEKDHIIGLSTFNNINSEKTFFQSDAYLICAGSYTSQLAKQVGIYLPIYPAKGYSATIPILDHEKINKVSLTDLDKKMVYTKIGDYLRVAGTAEFNGYNLERNPSREKALLDRTKIIFPEGLDYSKTEFWNGLRPATPGNVPIIEKSFLKNLYFNSGHGTLGWTMASGSGKLISQIINNTKIYEE